MTTNASMIIESISEHAYSMGVNGLPENTIRETFEESLTIEVISEDLGIDTEDVKGAFELYIERSNNFRAKRKHYSEYEDLDDENDYEENLW